MEEEIKPYGYIYLVTNTLNGKTYVGQTSTTVEQRWIEHLSASRTTKDGSHFHNAIRKYGQDAFTIRCVDTADSKTDLDAKESQYITILDSNNKVRGYNMTCGGEGITMTDEIRQKISSGNKGKKRTAEIRKRQGEAERLAYQLHPERIERIRKQTTGAGNPFYGKHHTEETKAKIAAANTGRRAWNKGIPMTDEQRAKSSLVHKGQKVSAETRARLSQAHLQRYKDPNERAKTGEHTRMMWQNPEYRKKVIDGLERARAEQQSGTDARRIS